MRRNVGGKTFSKSVGDVSSGATTPSDDFFIEYGFDKAYADGEDVIVEGFISTPNSDIDGDIVDARAFEKSIELYKKHPSIRREHKDPIGFAEEVTITDDGTYIKARITNDAPNEPTRSMILKGTLRGWSARFIPNKGGAKLLPKGKGRIHFTDARLLEASVTDIPRNSGGYLVVASKETRAAMMKSLGTSGTSDFQPHPKEENMDFIKILAQMLNQAGYKCDPDDQPSMLKAFGQMQSAADDNRIASVAKSIGLSEDADAEAIIAKIKESATEGTVAKSLFDAEVEKAKGFEIELLLAKHADRIPPSQREFAKSLAKIDTAMFDGWIAGLKPGQGSAEGDEDMNRNDAQSKGGDAEVATMAEDLRKSMGVLDKEKFTKFAAMKGHEVMSELLGQPVSETQHDKAYAMGREHLMR